MSKPVNPEKLNELIRQRKELRAKKKENVKRKKDGRESFKRAAKTFVRLRNEWRKHLAWSMKFQERAEKILQHMERKCAEYEAEKRN